MWRGPGPDPGDASGTGSPPGPSQELTDLKDQFDQQQVLIAQLKEMIRKNEQSTVTQEKVDEYMNTLSKRSAKTKGRKKDNNEKKTADIPASQKISLLRQQVEENKLRLAERGKSQKGIEEMVTQLKAQLDDSQLIIAQTPANLSLQDDKSEYNESSTSQELYSVLLAKEKRITDLNSKIEKFETSVFDLQESLKAKDALIDAKSKGIALMAEDLSKKRKVTQESLDETTEQMRKMQETFVVLENEMKNRQLKLLEDLKSKNYEIADLQEQNCILEREFAEFKENSAQPISNENTEDTTAIITEKDAIINEKDAIINEKTATINKLNETVLRLHGVADDEEVAKLKKQIEENNKSMIKVKAQNKSRVKELTKKIEAFKKINDSNAEIVKLEGENSRLTQKVAELEEEKGTLQLKIVETDSIKGSDRTERENELESQISHLQIELEEKDKIISILESEITRAKIDNEELSEKLNAQVTSEMTSIHFEEQLEALEHEKQTLITENQTTINERDELLETIEMIKKDKADLSNKLDHYIQENTELIDKLEKLSAEKVSSAESIEIVEGLTQQEKLELEAYEKNLDLVPDNLKASEENLPQVDLNESVNELNEETSELLQKIDLFTIERREVMEKMEELKTENNTLSLRIKEIENNRDILAETYEQLQTEKEVLDERVSVLEAENTSLKVQNGEKVEGRNDEFEAELQRLQLQQQNMDETVTKLHKENEKLVDGNNKLQEQLERLKPLEAEIVRDRDIIEEKRLEILEIQSQLEERGKEVCQLNNTIIDLTRTLSDLENDNKSLHNKVEQLEQQTSSLLEQITKNQEELECVNNTDWENRRLLESKDNDISKLIKERDNTASVIFDLQKTIQEKDDKFHKISAEFKNKYVALQQQLEENSTNLDGLTSPLNQKIEELTVKNKEQLEKMKKIAANLKKKTQTCQGLEAQLNEIKEENNNLKTSLQELELLREKLRQLEEKCEEIRVLEEKNVDLQNIVTELRVKIEKSNEKNLQEELLLTQENLGSVESSLRAKIQELEMIIETQEVELSKSRDRVFKLEEGISFVEERRASLERKAVELGSQLEEKSASVEEITKHEDLLEMRLAALTAHDEAIEQKLQETAEENRNLTDQNKHLEGKNQKLQQDLDEISGKLRYLEEKEVGADDLELKNDELATRNRNLELEVRNLQLSFEESKQDFEKLNTDWQTQFDEVLEERSELLVRCEKFEEELKEILQKELDFNNELLEYKTRLERSQEEINRYQDAMEKLSIENQELNALNQKIEEKEKEIQDHLTSQNRIELESLHQIIKQKEAEIEVLQEEKESNNIKLQELLGTKERLEQLELMEAERTAEAAVESIITKSEEHLTEIPTFTWSSSTNDPFDFLPKVQPVEEIKPPETNNEELEEKVKTLTFMLYTIEKEKDDALLQCQQLTNELARLLYEKQATVEGQILQNVEDSPDTAKELQKIEFEPTNPPEISTEEKGPVVEEVAQAREAYFCFKDPEVENIESQVLPDTTVTPDTRRELQAMEFVATNIPEGPCVSKEAYVCYNENDDGWGWGPEEAKLEAEFAQKESTESLVNRVRVLEVERENHLEEIRQLQVKSGKLIKKLKELKGKNEELKKKVDGDVFDLNDTIQEELKLQIQSIEKRLKEATMELDKEKQEKSAVLKRVDVLTAANERMVEMKEKQDVELHGWQQTSRELTTKLERFEWGNDGFSNDQKETQSESGKIQELNEIIKDLTLDNEELQHLLEEQRQLKDRNEIAEVARLEAELQVEKRNYFELESELNLYRDNARLAQQERDVLMEQLELKTKEEAQLNESLTQFQSRVESLQVENKNYEELQTKFDLLRLELESKGEEENTLMNLQYQYDAMVYSKDSLEKELESSIENRNTLQTQINELIKNNEVLSRELQNLQVENDNLSQLLTSKEEILLQTNTQLASTDEEKARLVEGLKAKDLEIESLKTSLASQLDTFQDNLNSQSKSAETFLEENKILTENISSKDAEILKLTAAMNQMVEEWEMRVNQRGSDVAESWKLHLDSRETEFSQTEEVLRKEIYELEQKTNVLVNENNELRKNVDAEIRNEVDRVAALQQQITDRQYTITELTHKLQDKQHEIEQLAHQIADLNVDKVIVDGVIASFEGQIDRNTESITKAIKDQKNELRQLYDTQNSHEQHLQGVITKLQEEEGLIVKLKDEVAHYREEVARLQENESVIASLTAQTESIPKLQDEVNIYKMEVARLNQFAAETDQLTVEITRLTRLLEEKDHSLAAAITQLQELQNLKEYANENAENLQQTLLDYQQQLQLKNTQLELKERELHNFKLLLEEKDREQISAMEGFSDEYKVSINEKLMEIDRLNQNLVNIEAYYQDALRKTSQTEVEVQELTLQLTNTNLENSKLAAKIEEQIALIDDDSKQLADLKEIIEEQVLKIEELKQELYLKSNDYDSLIAEVDLSKDTVREVKKLEELSEPALRAELDLALYMLHQRDVRCEELTVELTQLLEERDTLQLRLSNAIREKEQLRRIEPIESEIPGTSAQPPPEALSTKLTELKTVGYKKDKSLVDEKELRRLQELSFIEQHREDASRLPAEAAARLVDASYTLSRDVQSPSKVLLNWLRGRSTPKVNNV